MRTKYKISYLIIGALIFINQISYAQAYSSGDLISLNVMDYSLIQSNNASVALTLSSAIGGTALNAVSNSDMLLKLSSVSPVSTTRQVTSKISTGSIPPGTVLKVQSAPCTTINSGGNLGSVTSPITLSSIDQNIITGIGSCYTGTGSNDGYKITYTWAPTAVAADYSLIKATTSAVNITVVYTISAAN